MFLLLKKNLGFIVLFIIFLLGGTGFYFPWAGLAGIFASVFGLILILIKKRSLQFPSHWRLIAIYIGFCLLSFTWSVDVIQSYNIFLLILSGFGFLIFSYNAGINFKKFEKFLIILGLVFSLIFIVNIFLPQPIIDSLSLPFYSVVSQNHTHIGDYWVIIFLISVYNLLKSNKKTFFWFLLCFSIFILASSLSRAAYFSAAFGVLYLFYKEKLLAKYKRIFYICSLIFLILFLAVATQKSLISSRPYFVQSLVGLKKYPFGVGFGNFGLISKDSSTHIWGMSSFSFYTHNIILEFISGIGILSSVFIFWIYKIIKDIFILKQKNHLLSSLFLSLTVNFMFDYTYFVPTMIWIWFCFIGYSQLHKKEWK